MALAMPRPSPVPPVFLLRDLPPPPPKEGFERTDRNGGNFVDSKHRPRMFGERFDLP